MICPGNGAFVFCGKSFDLSIISWYPWNNRNGGDHAEAVGVF